MASQWYYSQDGQRRGPLSDSHLKKLAASGRLRPADLLWKEGMSRWVAASKVKGLFAGTARSTALSAVPSSANAVEATFTHHLACGDIYLERNKHDQAIAEYSEALRLEPSSSIAYCQRATAHRHKGDADRAIADCTAALRLAPNLAAAYKERANAYFERRQWDQALADYTQALRLNPAYMIAYYNRGLVYFNQGKFDLAIVEFTKAIELDAAYAPAFGYRSLCHLKKCNFDQARADCAEATRLDPTFDL
jgi:tetratricopeptide (TPR) repeat protein